MSVPARLRTRPARAVFTTALAIALGLTLAEYSRVRRRLAIARRDPLTGLPQRPELLDRTRRMSLGHDDTAALFLDCNAFKTLNDTYGHAAGDEVLIAVGQRLRQWCDAHGGMAARLGGDEFAGVVRIPSHPDRLRQALEALHRELTQPVRSACGDLPVSVSIGLARTSAMPGRSWREAMRAADVSMYRAKQRRRGFSIGSGSDATVDSSNGRRTGRRGTHHRPDQPSRTSRPPSDTTKQTTT